MSQTLAPDLPIHPRALAALSAETWTAILQSRPGADTLSGPAAMEHPSRAGVEILNWERQPDRGVLHDPPEKWYPLPRETYFALREAWLRDEDVPWPRTTAILSAWADRAGMGAYAVDFRGRSPAAALLLWVIDQEHEAGDDQSRGVQSIAYIPDVIWDPDAGVRSAGRYLLQELYLRYPRALAVVDMVPVTSPLNHVLMALGYRVYRRWEAPK